MTRSLSLKASKSSAGVSVRSGVACRWLDLFPFNLAREIAGDGGQTGIDARFRNIIESDFDAGQRADLGYSRAHLAGPDHAHFIYVHFIRPQ